MTCVASEAQGRRPQPKCLGGAARAAQQSPVEWLPVFERLARSLPAEATTVGCPSGSHSLSLRFP